MNAKKRAYITDQSGFDRLDQWISAGKGDWSDQMTLLVLGQKIFTFRCGARIMLVCDGLVGGLRQWARATGIPYPTIYRRWKNRKSDYENILIKAEINFSEHLHWPKEKRLMCRCHSCSGWIRKNGLKEEARKARQAQETLIKAAPPGVHDPEQWRLTIDSTYLFLFRKEWITIKECAQKLGVSYTTLSRRLVKYGMPIDKATTPVLRSVSHGTVWYYNSRKCRCELCRAANAAASRKYAKRKATAADNSTPVPR